MCKTVMMLLTVLLLLFLNIHNVQMDELLTVSSDMLVKYIRGNDIIHKISEGFKEYKVSVDKEFDDQALLLSIETKNDAETNYTFTPSPDILNKTDLGNFIISKAFTDSKLLDEAIDKTVKDLKKMKSYIKKPIMKSISEPRKSKSGKYLPNPRLVSTTIHTDKNREASFTHFLMLWGKFMDHDSALAPFNFAPEEEVMLGDGGERMDCCD
ncbi:uncharacterized protein LOC143226154 isoform X2 [Tachypleus tridentatus]|uniref:uncharacterized protein LOC143226154 isoform X2 n=1 Tax=Tachypleus tridentatus TaxID=6853 RepID=UPI003FD2443B